MLVGRVKIVEVLEFGVWSLESNELVERSFDDLNKRMNVIPEFLE